MPGEKETEVTPISRGMAVHDNTMHNPDMLRSDQRVPFGNMPAGTATHVLTANGAGVNPSYQAAGAGALPSGCIVMWSGLLANIPAGYILCDGGGGSPNLLTRFVRQVPDAITNPGGVGGANTHTHAQHGGAGGHQHNLQGGHQHNLQGGHTHGGDGGHQHNADGGHQHTTAGDHDHDYHSSGSALCGDFGPYQPFISPAQHTDQGAHTHNAIGDHSHPAVGDHTHNAIANHQHDAIANHQHDAIANHQHDAHDAPSNVPVYFELAFIMKT